MDEKTEAALRKSIEHWRKNLEAETPDDASVGPSECALCDLYWSPYGDASVRCLGCPVREFTGLPGCRGTPYYDMRVESSLDCWWETHYDEEESQTEKDTARDVWREAARAELKFLEGLLP